jgi:ubiquinone/menaquinone biosynthesis C-methylase UbiE
VEDILRHVDHDDLTKPPVYRGLINEVFADPDLPTILRDPLLRGMDKSIDLFLGEMQARIELRAGMSVGVVCSGSGALTAQLIRVAPGVRVTNYDRSISMCLAPNQAASTVRADLATPCAPHASHDLIICQGSLRYFAEVMPQLVTNLKHLAGPTGQLFLGEVDAGLIRVLADQVESSDCRVNLSTREGVVFRNTVLYLLLHRYRHDETFQRQVERARGDTQPFWQVLIAAAGVKVAPYYFCHASFLRADSRVPQS